MIQIYPEMVAVKSQGPEWKFPVILFFFYFVGFPYSRVKLINNSHNQIVSALANFSSYFTVSTYFECK